jgi:hypothetical protein
VYVGRFNTALFHGTRTTTFYVSAKAHKTIIQATLTFSTNNRSTKFSFPKCVSMPSISFCICEKRPCKTLCVYARLSVFSNSSRINFLASKVVLPVARRCWRRLGRRTLPPGACDCDCWRLWISGSENLPSSRSSQKPFWIAY